MSIFGLEGLLIQNKDKFSSSEELCDTLLVIDYHDLQLFLLEKACLNENLSKSRADKYGCNFKEYSRVIRVFFSRLSKCGIKSYLVKDDPWVLMEEDPIGFQESREVLLKKRAQEKMLDAQRQNKHPIDGEDLLAPRLFQVVFNKIISILGIHVLRPRPKANEQMSIIMLANRFKCPVLTNNIDLINKSIDKGVIILKTFIWDDTNDKFIKCDVFNRNLFASVIQGLKPECLPFLEVFLGKISKEMRIFDPIVNSIVRSGDIGDEIKAKDFSQKKLVRLLKWLDGKTREEVLSFIVNNIDEEKRNEAEYVCHKVLDNESFQRIELKLRGLYPDNMDQHLLNLHYPNHLIGPCVNAISGKPYYDESFLSDFSKPSPLKLEFRAISVAMVLLRPKSIDKLKEDGSYDEKKHVLQVYTRMSQDENDQPQLGKFEIKPMEHLDGFGSLNHLDCYSFLQQTREQTIKLISETFRFNQFELNEMIHLISDVISPENARLEAAICIMLVKFIAIETKTPIDRAFVASVLLLMFDWANNYNSQLSDNIQSLEKAGKDYTDEPVVYKRFVNDNLCLQAAFHAFYMLNYLPNQQNTIYSPYNDDLNEPLSWFNGRVMFRLMVAMNEQGVDNFLASAPQYQRLVGQVLDMLTFSVLVAA